LLEEFDGEGHFTWRWGGEEAGWCEDCHGHWHGGSATARGAGWLARCHFVQCEVVVEGLSWASGNTFSSPRNSILIFGFTSREHTSGPHNSIRNIYGGVELRDLDETRKDM
jgi:hypothetical protein